MIDGVVFEFENGNVAVGGSAGEKATSFMRGPGYDVDRGFVQGKVVDALPLVVLSALFFPDEDFAIKAGGGKDVAILWMRPGDAPYSTFMAVPFVSRALHVSLVSFGSPFQSLYQTL